tara:strand:- start:218 stop:1180 length:963 start_codon:yes stop_codon:yes gene_type:complete
MDKWFRILREERTSIDATSAGTAPEEDVEIEESKNPSFLKRVRAYTKDRDELLNVGGQKNTPPYTQKMGSHVTFDKQTGNLGEEIESESFEKQPELEPHFWENKKLDKKVARRLKRIAEDFAEGLEVPAEMIDLRFTGSLANYNWSMYSDIDLHLVVDFAKIDSDTELVKAFFDAARMRWNELHTIRIFGYEVEVYVENVGDAHRSSGVYSIFEDTWAIEPDPTDVHFDFALARAKSDDTLTQISMIEKFAEKKPRSALAAIKRLKMKIRSMRRAGLDSPEQEYSAENIAFKILRREEALQRLNDLKYNAYDNVMSMELG